MKTNIKTLLSILSFLLLPFSVCISSCSDNEKPLEENMRLSISAESVDFLQQEGQRELTVTCLGEWNARVVTGGEWCTVEKLGTKLIISVTLSEQEEVREASVTVTANGETKALKVRQLGYAPEILVSKQIFSAPVSGSEIMLDITTNLKELDITCSEWIKEKKPVTRAIEMVTTSHSFTIAPQAADQDRIGEILIKQKKGTKEVKVVVTQKGLNNYEAEGIEDIKDDIKVKVRSGTASSFQPGSGIEKSFDGDINTLYHSNWANTGTNYFPITLTYQFDAGSDMDYFVYYPRTNGANGLFKEIEIRVKSNANTRGVYEWNTVIEKNFNGSSTATRVDFPKSQIGVQEIQIVVKSGAGDGQGFATCAEIEFYKKNPDAFDPKSLFTDGVCTELKPGITDLEIENCPYSFYKNMAYYIKRGKYSTEFRIQEYKAYPHPNTQAQQAKTNQYNLLDNPTGIAVDGDEQIMVFVGPTNGQQIALKVQNLNNPGGDGYGGDSYALVEGANKIRIKNKGLMYVMYHTPDDETAAPIKIHIASGKVNGYFDSAKHKASDWSRLLNAATDTYFDVLGKYAHLTFPVYRFKNHTPNGKELIDVYDQIVQHQMELMGLFKYNKVFKNRMYFHVVYKSYMYATSYRTAYHDDTLAELCNVEKVRTGPWGPAHEVGHCNQTRPGLKWLGTTEVTNNIMSEYIQTTVLKQGSRIQVEDMGINFRNRYSKAWSGIIADKCTHSEHADVFCKLIPFWQLELYFGRVLGRTPLEQADKGGFYPDVYEYVRTHDNLKTAGEQQTEFVYICSKLSGYNLLDFFEKWGFLTPVDVEIDDYGKGMMTVTQARIDEIKQRVNALGLPKPDVALEYISDNTWELYKGKPAIVRGTASRSGDKLMMDGWRNVVVYEVVDTSSQRPVFICSGETIPSNNDFFTLPFSWKSTYKVYAVAVDGTKVEVTF